MERPPLPPPPRILYTLCCNSFLVSWSVLVEL
ncbi:hypothetical protein FOXYSP1_14885 [Fusarium oxysporum f. sp. phaseoli]